MKRTHTSRIVDLGDGKAIAPAPREGEANPFELTNGWDRLAEAIEASPLKQNEIAVRCGISPVTFSRWKNAVSGHLPESCVPFIMLAKTLNVSLDWLFYLDEVGLDLTPEETELIEQVQQILKKKGKKKPAKKG